MRTWVMGLAVLCAAACSESEDAPGGATTGSDAAISDTGGTGGEPDTVGGDDIEQGCSSAAECQGEVTLGVCQVAACLDGECQAAAATAGATCDAGGGPCVVGGLCDRSGLCQPQLKSCDDQNACTADSCGDDGTCINAPLAECEDQCVTVKDCPTDVPPCHQPACQAGQCAPTPKFDGADCSDDLALDACVVAGVCEAGECKPVETDCDDGVDCTLDSCVAPEGCKNEPEDALCEIQDCVNDTDCAGIEIIGQCKQPKCFAGKCVPGPAPDGNACAKDEWADNPCIEGGTCAEGTCVPNQKECDDGLECTQDDCDVETGSCTHVATDSEDCAEVCETAEQCPEGLYCDDGLFPGGDAVCAPLKEDGVACTGDDECASGACGGCFDGQSFSAGWCYTPSSKDLEQPCKADSECMSSHCTAVCPFNPTGACECEGAADCPEGFVCESGVFANTCVEKPDAKPLGEACDKNDECVTGQCEGDVCVCAVDSDCADNEWCNALPGIANKCVAFKAECDTCAQDKECGPGAECLAFGLPVSTPKCVIPESKAVGEACCKNAQCVSGSCSDGQCAE